jgi:hypothetical protein
MNCQQTTDRCYKATCQCGESIGYVCDVKTEFPFCKDGQCICSKDKTIFESGDGTTQGSCSSPLEKCQADGSCEECTRSGQCASATNGLTDTCLNMKCVCGTDEYAKACNQTTSNRCIKGICMCGSNPGCSQTNHIAELANCDENDCGNTTATGICGCKWENGVCKIPRSDQEMCQPISKFYNPLHIKGELRYNNESVTLCDDVIGRKENVGKYFCLGN